MKEKFALPGKDNETFKQDFMKQKLRILDVAIANNGYASSSAIQAQVTTEEHKSMDDLYKGKWISVRKYSRVPVFSSHHVHVCPFHSCLSFQVQADSSLPI
jgi:hypothetical protein